MRTIFYDRRDLTQALSGTTSVFLAGPTARTGGRTAWRARAIERFGAARFEGALIIPEFEARSFAVAAPLDYAAPESPAPSMRAVSYNILAWETTGIEHASVVLFWMPFDLGSPESAEWLPCFTTRAEVSRELVRAPHRIVLGMPDAAHSSSHIRYHAHQARVPIHATLESTVDAALRVLSGSRDLT